MIPVNDFFAIMPALVLAIFGCALLIMRLEEGGVNVAFVLAGEAIATLGLWRQSGYQGLQGFFGSVVVDSFGVYVNSVCLLGAVLAALAAYRYLEREGEETSDFFALLLFAQAGMYFVVSGIELVTIFVGLETMALSFYVLTGYLRAKHASNEAALKYLLLGACSSGLLLYGFSILYGLTGTTRLANMATMLLQRDANDPLVLLALGPILLGLLFKVAAAPVHMWAPDAYEGAPTPVAAFLATASKAASFALLLRLLAGPLAQFRSAWEPLIVAAALGSLAIGTFAALTQQSVKRLLAYSSIAHVGYLLLGVVAGNQTGLEAILFYLFVYTLMTSGAFLVLAAMPSDEISSFRGLLFRHPLAGCLMLVLLTSLAGLPPTAGFLPKYQIFLSLLQTRNYWLAVAAALYVAVGIYLYFRVAREVVTESSGHEQVAMGGIGWRAAVGTAAILSLGFGFNPQPALEWASGALR
jgi:NADH-quinone oxidoreductase subunit N